MKKIIIEKKSTVPCIPSYILGLMDKLKKGPQVHTPWSLTIFPRAVNLQTNEPVSECILPPRGFRSGIFCSDVGDK